MKAFLIVLLIVIADFHPLQAQEKPPTEMMKSSSQWNWTKQKWVKSEVPFLHLREKIDREFAKSVGKKGVLIIFQEHASQAKKIPNDTKAAFAWIYSAYKAQQLDPQFDRKLFTRARMALLLGRYPFDNSEWARLRFLVESQPFPRSPLTSIGERLLEKYPQDAEVKYQLVRAFSPTNPVEKQKALKYSQDLIRLEPKRPSYHALLAGIYLKSWLAHKNKTEADKAITAYNQFLLLAPLNHQFRPQAKRTIELLKRP